MIQSQYFVPSLSATAVERSAQECAAVWRRFQAEMPDFADLPTAEVKQIASFAREARKKFTHVLVLGIGGSSLGAQAVVEGVQGSLRNLGRTSPKIYFLDNVDPTETTTLLQNIPLKKTLVLLVSKSGGTLETVATWQIVKKKLGKNWQKNTVVITDPDTGYLRQLAKREKLVSFAVPPAVGGRFSVLSPVGLVPAALTGVNIRELLSGAREVQAADAFHAALVQAELFAQGRSVTVFCPYARQLRKLGEWYCQLLAESIGKHQKVGITPEVSLGATDQHSKLQLWSDGPDDKTFLFFGVENFAKAAKIPTAPAGMKYLAGRDLRDVLDAELAGTVQALREKKRPIVLFTLPDCSARTLGWLTQFFMLQVAFLGEMLGVNPYDQPGVERGKVVSKEILMKLK